MAFRGLMQRLLRGLRRSYTAVATHAALLLRKYLRQR